MRELGPFLARIADTQLEKGLDGEPTALRFPTPRLAAIKNSGLVGPCQRENLREGRVWGLTSE